MSIFNLPDLGEGLPDAEIQEWYVKVGDEVEVDQPLASMETAKAVVDLPSPQAGKIIKLYGKAGDTIDVDTPLIEFEGSADTGTVVGAIEVGETVIDEAATGVKVKKTSSKIKIIPAARALAKKLGVDLDTINTTSGTITAKDVKLAAEQAGGDKPDEKLHSTRRAMAINMARIHTEVAPVTIVDDVDIHAWHGKQKLTMRVIRAIQNACAVQPDLNAHFNGKELTLKLLKEVNLGLAVDTPHGLYVPVIKDIANKKDSEIKESIDEFKVKAENNSFTPADFHDATIILSNFGVFAGRYANPMVVPPTVAIIGMGKLRDEVVAFEGKAVVHPVLPLAVTIDHRAVTGGESARFLQALINDLSN